MVLKKIEHIYIYILKLSNCSVNKTISLSKFMSPATSYNVKSLSSISQLIWLVPLKAKAFPCLPW